MSNATNYSQYPPSGYPQFPQYPPKKRSRWWIPIAIIGAIFVALGVLALVVITAINSSFKDQAVNVEPNSVLHLKVNGILKEQTATNPFQLFSGKTDRSITLFDALTAINYAKTDENIKGIYIDGECKAGFVKATEIREALLDFKKSGKFIYAFLETGNENDYYLASVADSVFMPAEGMLEMNGFAVNSAFFKGTFEKLGVSVFVDQFEEYKSAGEAYSRSEYSAPAKEEIRALLAQRTTTFVNAVAQSRSVDEKFVSDVLNRGLYTADSLKAVKFIDAIASEGDVKEFIKNKANNKTASIQAAAAKVDADDVQPEENSKSKKSQQKKNTSSSKLHLITIGSYVNSSSYGAGTTGKTVSDAKVAIISGTGTIVSGSGESDSDGGELISSGAFIKMLRKVRDNDLIKAVILRIDSPGGSVIASDAIWEEIRKVREKKPVYASMSDVAASGGYYMSMPCDTIIAHPNTITGSIGVIAVIPNFKGTMEKMGVTFDTVKFGQNSLFLDPVHAMSSADKEKFHGMTANMYRRFVSRVAESRKMSFDETRAVAKGRVWTGADAKVHKLVDTLGGLQTAIGIAQRRLGIPESSHVAIEVFPKPKNPVESLLTLLQKGDDEAENSFALYVRGLAAKLNASPETKAFFELLPTQLQTQVRYALHIVAIGAREHAVMALPAIPEIQ